MKWAFFIAVMIFLAAFTVGMIAIGKLSKSSMDYDDREIDSIEDVRVFLEECKQKFALNCEGLLLNKLNDARTVGGTQ